MISIRSGSKVPESTGHFGSRLTQDNNGTARRCEQGQEICDGTKYKDGPDETDLGSSAAGELAQGLTTGKSISYLCVQISNVFYPCGYSRNFYFHELCSNNNIGMYGRTDDL